MTAIARIISRAPAIEREVEAIEALIVFCGIGLSVSLLLASCGIEFSAGLF